jgi:hypothetical protein
MSPTRFTGECMDETRNATTSSNAINKQSSVEGEQLREKMLALKKRIQLLEESQKISQETLDSIVSF